MHAQVQESMICLSHNHPFINKMQIVAHTISYINTSCHSQRPI
jgi:hypothetical protein